MIKLPDPPKGALEKLKSKLCFLDMLVASGEEPYEIEFEVGDCAQLASVLFFGWLVNRGFEEGAEVLSLMAEEFVKDVYLDEERKQRRSCTLSGVSKKKLGEFIGLVDFAVSEELWNSHLNPFDGLRLFYQFLEGVGYDARLTRRENALRDIRRKAHKKPCAIPQNGCELTQ